MKQIVPNDLNLLKEAIIEAQILLPTCFNHSQGKVNFHVCKYLTNSVLQLDTSTNIHTQLISRLIQQINKSETKWIQESFKKKFV